MQGLDLITRLIDADAPRVKAITHYDKEHKFAIASDCEVTSIVSDSGILRRRGAAICFVKRWNEDNTGPYNRLSGAQHNARNRGRNWLSMGPEHECTARQSQDRDEETNAIKKGHNA